MEKETGLQYLEVVVRYLASALDEDELGWLLINALMVIIISWQLM
ncbi:hypothetical protein [Desulfobacter sp.]